MVLVRKIFWIKFFVVLSFFDQAFGSSEKPVFIDCVDLRSPVSQGGLVSQLYQAKPGSPLYQVCSRSMTDRLRGQFPIIKHSPEDDMFDKKQGLSISIFNPLSFFITLESLSVHKAQDDNECVIPKERHWIEQAEAIVSTTEDVFLLKVEKLGKRDVVIFNGLLRCEASKGDDCCLRIEENRCGHQVLLSARNCLVEEARLFENDGPLKLRFSAGK